MPSPPAQTLPAQTLHDTRPTRHRFAGDTGRDPARGAAALLVAATLAHGIAVAWLLSEPHPVSATALGAVGHGTVEQSAVARQTADSRQIGYTVQPPSGSAGPNE